MTQEEFHSLMSTIAETIGDRPVEPELGVFLHETFPPDGTMFEKVHAACRAGLRDGWICPSERNGIRYGRPIKPTLGTHEFSVDVVLMDDCIGPHHAHPGGEIDLILPEEDGAEFDGQGRGWLVYGPGTAHPPTVSGGRAIVVYLLPKGEIDFTRVKKD